MGKTSIQNFANDIELVNNYDNLKINIDNYRLPDGSKLLELPRPPVEIPGMNPEQMLLSRHLAIKIPAITSNDFNEGIKASWQRFWLKCCLSDKCDYGFNLLKNIKPRVDREEEILILTQKDKLIWDYVDINNVNTKEKHGRKLYIEICLNFLLKRFSYLKALKLLGMDKETFLRLPVSKAITKLKANYFCSYWPYIFIPMRIIFGLLVTNYFIISSKWLWGLVIKAVRAPIIYSLTTLLLIVLSWLYLSFVECYLEIERDSKESMKRGMLVFFLNLFWSGLFSVVLIYGIKILHFIFDFNDYHIVALGSSFWGVILYSVIAVFISIFIQHFWQEKTITEPY